MSRFAAWSLLVSSNEFPEDIVIMRFRQVAYAKCRDDGEKKKSQKLDEGVPRASDWRSRLEMLESASPVAFAKNPRFSMMQPEFHSSWT
jgi:hypothetical protein